MIIYDTYKMEGYIDIDRYIKQGEGLAKQRGTCSS